MTLAFPGPTSSHSEARAIRSFLDALADKGISRQTRDKEPKTLDEAFKIAMRLEGYRRADMDNEERSKRRAGRVRATTGAEEELEQMKRRIYQVERKLNTPSRPPPATYPIQPYVGGHGNRPRQPGNERRCYACHAPDHQARYCPRTTQAVNETADPYGNGPGCYECRALDHFARNCPRRMVTNDNQPGPTEAPDAGRSYHIMESNCA